MAINSARNPSALPRIVPSATNFIKRLILDSTHCLFINMQFSTLFTMVVTAFATLAVAAPTEPADICLAICYLAEPECPGTSVCYATPSACPPAYYAICPSRMLTYGLIYSIQKKKARLVPAPARSALEREFTHGILNSAGPAAPHRRRLPRVRAPVRAGIIFSK
jgi:hypothetical protein